MGHIFRNAFTCFAATSARDSSGGLFFDRDPQSLRPLQVEAHWSTGQKNFLCEDREIWHNIIGSSVLTRRAWIVQERVFATRVIHFTNQQLFWECLTMEACEAYPDHLFKGGGLGPWKDWSLNDWTLTSGEGPTRAWGPLARNVQSDPYVIWSRLVQFYTSGNLTKNEDKLVAIGGLALDLQEHLGSRDKYLAGLWRTQLVPHLLWEITDLPGGSRPNPYRAPTWSWASVDGTVGGLVPLDNNFGGEYKPVIKVIDVNVTYVKNNIALGVENGKLRVIGAVTALQWLPDLDVIDPSDPVSEPPHWPLSAYGKVIKNSEAHFDFIQIPPNQPGFFILPIALKDYQSPQVPITLHGLLLVATMREKGEYERCGRFVISGQEEVMQYMEAEWYGLRPFLYEEAHDGGSYTISIV